MVRAENLANPYQVAFQNGTQSGVADTAAGKGGSGQGFRPHELLEAALASCMVMTLRMYAERHAIDYTGIGVAVRLDRTDPEHPVFESAVSFPADFPADRRGRMLQVAERCPVHRTLAAGLGFRTV
jgi:putative redox protein